MSVETAGRLEDEIDGVNVRDQDVEVQVKRLFEDLRGNHHPSVPF